MKPYYLLLFLSSLAMSQTSAPPTPPSGTIFLHDGIIFVPDCDMSISVHGKSKKIAEIFQEECGGAEAQLNADKKKLADAQYFLKIAEDHLTDVPAIQEEYVKHEAHECWGEGDLLRCAGDTPDMGKRWTCADKANYSLLPSVDGKRAVCHRLEGK